MIFSTNEISYIALTKGSKNELIKKKKKRKGKLLRLS